MPAHKYRDGARRRPWPPLAAPGRPRQLYACMCIKYLLHACEYNCRMDSLISIMYSTSVVYIIHVPGVDVIELFHGHMTRGF